MPAPTIADTLTLPCGTVLPNRLCKAAMTEGLADPRNHATPRHLTLYRRWAQGGSGLLITGNIQVDRRYLERAGNVAIEAATGDEGFEALQAYAAAATENGAHAWVQLCHAGRQTPKAVSSTPVAPSAVRLALPRSAFGDPRALEAWEIKDVRDRFAHAAEVVKRAGFTGIQIHSAHGYLLSEFLSPRVNQRTDDWGGTLRNRARLLLETIAACRAEVGADFPISVKLNSSDFQKGGFTHEECLEVVQWLGEAGIDLLEISGGTYEQPRMMNSDGVEEVVETYQRESTRQREAYFLDYADRIRTVAGMPLMVTGGFRTRTGMNEALASGAADVIGLGRPLCVLTELPRLMLAGSVERGPEFEKVLRLGPGFLGPQSPVTLIKIANAFGIQGWWYEQIYRLADGLEPDTRLSVFRALGAYQRTEQAAAKALEAVGSRRLS